ncbi:MAG: ATP-binding cassette domain-containing protein [Propionibacteriaceae bacterium]|jgi:D-methionine transport system ATP-binding protein|nr:ATP-binding cassette domain-containing protein [Propionibacteriaceae bacterium]
MITLQNVRKEYPGSANRPPFLALDNINLHIERGSIHGIVGPSGAGKTTLMRCITGLERVTDGQVIVDGTDITKLNAHTIKNARRSIGMVFQHVHLFDQRTAFQNLVFPMKIAGFSKEEQKTRATELLELVGLADRADHYPAQLSGGQQQRVGIARALAANPPILLCDEPSSALDWDTTRQVLELIVDLRDRLGITVLIITHDLAVVRQACDTVTSLRQGKIAESGKLSDLLADQSTQLSHELIPLAATQIGDASAQYELSYSTAHTPTASVLKVLAELADAVTITSGTVETLAGQSVGRFQVGVAPGSGAVDKFKAAGLSVREVK